MKSATFDQSAIMSDPNNNSSSIILADSSGTISNIGAGNNKKTNEKYSLRQRQKRTTVGRGVGSTGGGGCGGRRSATVVGGTASASSATAALSADSNGGNDQEPARSSAKDKPKSKAAPLSKYRRKTANARERTRMREINSAFENLRRCVPHSLGVCGRQSPSSTNEKLTKITTLRLAMKYIRTLSEAIANPGYDMSFMCNSNSNSSFSETSIGSHSPSSSQNLENLFASATELMKPTVKSRTITAPKTQNRIRQKAKQKSESININNNSILQMPSPTLDDNPADLGLLLESDGESLHLSEPCLSPLGHQMKPFACSNNTTSSQSSSSCSGHHLNDSALELGLLLESDSDSLQFSEPCLSPLGALDSFNPFGDLLHTEFTEQTSLDMYLT